jgi:DNA ligase-1
LVLDGELFLTDFKTTVSEVRKKADGSNKVCFIMFDSLNQKDITSVFQHNRPGEQPYLERRGYVQKIFDASYQLSHRGIIDKYDHVRCDNKMAVDVKYAENLHYGHEGLILKHPEGVYHPRRNKAWMKMKEEQSLDLKVVGIVEGEGRLEGTLGKIMVEYNGVEIGVGTGFTDAERDVVWQLHKLGMLMGTIAEVHYQYETEAGSLRHPAFKGLRPDKDEADV